jgi:hypothetical protein
MNRRSSVLLALALALLTASQALAQGAPCIVPGPGWSNCAGFVSFSSYFKSAVFMPHQATAGTGVQSDITVNFSPWVHAVRIWANDPDFTNSVYETILSCCTIGPFSINGDGAPGVFSVNSLGLSGSLEIIRLTLRSNPSDYVNWRVEYQKDGGTFWCKITSQSSSCGGVNVTVSPWYQGSNFDPFQALDNGTGPQAPIEITFGFPLYSVGATAVDPDFGGTRMDAYASDGTFLGTAFFDGDNNPGFTTTSTKSITDARGIAKIVLTAANNDYVAFQGITATPF